MNILSSIKIPAIFIAIFWVIKIFEELGNLDFGFLGIYPRSVKGIIGLFFWPFIHGNYDHLISNTATFFILGASVLFFYPNIAYKVAFYLFVITGIGVWLFARNAYHIGASGLIYGFASFLFFSGVFRKDNRSVVISLVIAFLYGSMIYGIFPTYPGISYESHLIGLLAGIYCANIFKDELANGEETPYVYHTDIDEEFHDGYRNVETPLFKYNFKAEKEDKIDEQT